MKYFSKGQILIFLSVLVGMSLLQFTLIYDSGIVSPLADIANISVMDKMFNVKGDGITDDTLALRKAVDYAKSNNMILFFPAGNYLVSSDQDRNTGDDWWALSIPSGVNLSFEKGSKLILKDNAKAWSRVLVFNLVSNINIYGYVEIDGRCSTVTDGNEQMAGALIFSSHDIYIQNLYSHDCYGDNLFVGGLDESPSYNIKIDYLKGVKAGRKNLVINAVDQLHIVTAVLDNSQGGAPEFTGSNSLDVEPDDFSGTKTFYQRIDSLSTYGSGNDFTCGIERSKAEKFHLDIGTFDCRLVGVDAVGIFSYGITFTVDKLSIISVDGLATGGIYAQYACIINAKEVYIENINGRAVEAYMSDSWAPDLQFGKLKIDGKNLPHSEGIYNSGANISVGSTPGV